MVTTTDVAVMTAYGSSYFFSAAAEVVTEMASANFLEAETEKERIPLFFLFLSIFFGKTGILLSGFFDGLIPCALFLLLFLLFALPHDFLVDLTLFWYVPSF